MAKASKGPSDTQLRAAVKAYYDNYGNKAEAARALDLSRSTYADRLKLAETRLKLKIGKVAGGKVETAEIPKLPLPKKGHRAFYLTSSIQNNTHLHPAWPNVLALLDWLNAQPKCSARLMLGTFTYDKSSYGKNSVKLGTHKRSDYQEELWYDPLAVEYIVDYDVELAPGLVWCGSKNILPTVKRPLNGKEDLNGRKSNIVPHVKRQFVSVGSMPDEAVKFNMTTGTLTQKNYIQKNAGQDAEKYHAYGLRLIEVDDEGNWYPRFVAIGKDDAILDIGPAPYSGIRVQAGQVKVMEKGVLAGIYWGDLHAAEMERWAYDLAFGPGGALDVLQPKNQVLGDYFSMRSRSHHELKNFLATYKKHVHGEESVEDEVQITYEALSGACRPFCNTYAVPDNHSRHLDVWVNEADHRKDPLNAKYWSLLLYQMLDAVDRGDADFKLTEWAIRQKGELLNFTFVEEDASLLIAGVENGLHGDLGINGGKGSTAGLTKLARPVNKGHDHIACEMDDVFSAGAFARRFPYMKGPSSHSITHILTYDNGERALLMFWNGKYRA